jgi:hypothetical protein
MRFSHSEELPCDPATAYAAISDVACWPSWLDTVTSLDLLDPGGLHVGQRAVIRLPKLPRAVWTVTAVEPGTGFTWQTGSPGITVIADHRLVPTANGCLATLSIDQQGPLSGLAKLLRGRLTREYLQREGACLRRRVADA